MVAAFCLCSCTPCHPLACPPNPSPPTSSPSEWPLTEHPTPNYLPQARALEAVGTLHNMPALEGALKLANHHRATALAERISAFIEQRLAMEAAAAELEQEDGYGDGEAAGRQVRTVVAAAEGRPELWFAVAVFCSCSGVRAILHSILTACQIPATL